MSPEEHAEIQEALVHLDPLAREYHGKSIMDCTWDEIREMSRWQDAMATRTQANLDQLNAELRERVRRGDTR